MRYAVVKSAEQVRYGLFLDGGRRFEAELGDGAEDLGPDTEFGKSGHGFLKRTAKVVSRGEALPERPPRTG